MTQQTTQMPTVASGAPGAENDTLVDKLTDFTHGVYQGTTLGFADEAAGGIQGLVFGGLDKARGKSFTDGFKRGYRMKRDQWRREYDAASERHPGATLAGEFVPFSSLLSTSRKLLALPRARKQVEKLIGKANNLTKEDITKGMILARHGLTDIARVLPHSFLNASLGGAVYGLGTSKGETASDMATDTAIGAATAGAAGVAFPLAAHGLNRLRRKIVQSKLIQKGINGLSETPKPKDELPSDKLEMTMIYPENFKTAKSAPAVENVKDKAAAKAEARAAAKAAAKAEAEARAAKSEARAAKRKEIAEMKLKEKISYVARNGLKGWGEIRESKNYGRYGDIEGADYEIFGYRNDPEAAVRRLLEDGNGYIRDIIPGVDLYYGNSSGGLKHLLKRRKEQGIDQEEFVQQLIKALKREVSNEVSIDKDVLRDGKILGGPMGDVFFVRKTARPNPEYVDPRIKLRNLIPFLPKKKQEPSRAIITGYRDSTKNPWVLKLDLEDEPAALTQLWENGKKMTARLRGKETQKDYLKRMMNKHLTEKSSQNDLLKADVENLLLADQPKENLKNALFGSGMRVDVSKKIPEIFKPEDPIKEFMDRMKKKPYKVKNKHLFPKEQQEILNELEKSPMYNRIVTPLDNGTWSTQFTRDQLPLWLSLGNKGGILGSLKAMEE